MPTYLTPGVYVEEVPANTQPLEGVGTSTGAFVGIAERGPINTPVLVTSFSQFVNTFGRFFTHGGNDAYLAYAVYGFFAEGGSRCFVVRVAGNAANAAETAAGTSGTLEYTFAAKNPGEWGNRVSVTIENASNESATTHFDLTIQFEDTLLGTDQFVTETYTDITGADLLTVVNSGSAFVEVSTNEALSGTASADRPSNLSATNLASGADDLIGTVNLIGSDSDPMGLHALTVIDDVNLIAIPDIHSGILGNTADQTRSLIISALEYCAGRGDCFFIADTVRSLATAEDVKNYKQGTGYTDAGFSNDYSALYYPWVRIPNPLTRDPITLPPSGHVMGAYARTDQSRGVYKAPAGTVDGQLRSVSGVDVQITRADQASLNPVGVNAIRSFPQSGIVIWGARTLSANASLRYVPVRRLLLFLAESLDEGTQFVVFEPNDPALWGKVRRTLNAFLTRIWRDGALFGASPEEAFFVKVDEENNPPEVRDAGQLIIEVGVAPVKPAEFVIIRISQQVQASGE